MNHANIPIFVSHMGCPFQCVFCNQKTITGIDTQTEQRVREDIERALSTIKQKHEVEIAFFGGSFTMIDPSQQKRYLQIATEYVEAHSLAGIRLSTRPDGIDWDVLDMLSDFPVRTVELGVQSMDEEVLRASGRGHGIIAVLRAVNLLKRYGFQVGLQMMLGLPQDSYDKAVYTAEKLVSMKPDFVRVYPTIVLKDTPLEAMYEQGIYLPWDLEEAVETASEVTAIFMRAEIPIIRMGLYSNEAQFEGNIVAGPYHPAFRELVLSRMYRRMLEKNMILGESVLLLEAPSRDVSLIVGHKRENVNYFRERYGIAQVRVTADDSLTRYTLRYNDKIYPVYQR